MLHHKHSSLLNAGYVKAARTSYDYQIKLTDGPVQGTTLLLSELHMDINAAARVSITTHAHRHALSLVLVSPREASHQTRFFEGHCESLRHGKSLENGAGKMQFPFIHA